MKTFFKLPLYFEVDVDGDFDPKLLSESFSRHFEKKFLKFVNDSSGLPLDSKTDILDSTADRIRLDTKTKRVKISLSNLLKAIEKQSKALKDKKDKEIAKNYKKITELEARNKTVSP